MGKLYGIGVGPGDPELLTLKAHRILKEADVVFCPEKEEGAGSFAYDIVKKFVEEGKAQVVNLVYPMHYHGQELCRMWRENAETIAAYLEGGRMGAFITLGDPAVYSTFMYTLPYMEEQGIEVEVVPGIPSFCAVADALKLPLMAWNEDLAVAPVRKNSSSDLGRILREHDNVILMKPSADKEALLRALRENHLEDHFVLISKAGTGQERVITDLKELEEYELPYLSTVLVKKKGRTSYASV